MKKEKFKKGWFWWCPIFWDEENKELFPRYYGGVWFVLFDITLWMHNSMLIISDFIGIDIEKGYPIKIVK